MSNRPKTWDNSQVQAFLDGFLTPSELCREYPAMDDVFVGVLALRTPASTSTRSLSRLVLFTILQRCAVIDIAEVDLATDGRYAYASQAAYAAAARVASKALMQFISGQPGEGSLADARRRLDGTYETQLQRRIHISNLIKGTL